MKPKDRLPSLPEQHAFMRVEVCFNYLTPFMSDEEQLSIRAKIYRWDVENDTSEKLPCKACTEPCYAKGLCRKHYQRQYYGKAA